MFDNECNSWIMTPGISSLKARCDNVYQNWNNLCKYNFMLVVYNICINKKEISILYFMMYYNKTL